MNYSAYLRTKEWQSRRKAALKRAGYRCQVCNSPDHLEVHHRTYEHIGNELPDDLTVLCDSCHELFSKKMPRWYGWLGSKIFGKLLEGIRW